MTGIQSQNTFGGIAAVYIGYPAKEDEESRLVAMCASRGYVVAAVYRENDDKEAFGVLKRVIKDAEQAIKTRASEPCSLSKTKAPKTR